MTETEKRDLYLSGIHDGLTLAIRELRALSPYNAGADFKEEEYGDDPEHDQYLQNHAVITATGRVLSIRAHSFLDRYRADGEPLHDPAAQDAPTHPGIVEAFEWQADVNDGVVKERVAEMYPDAAAKETP